MPDAGGVDTVDFPGAQGVKRRPAVVIPAAIYHTHRPDVIVGLLTTNTSAAIAPTDYILQDWSAAGLKLPSAFRAYLVTLDQRDVRSCVGRLSVKDWESIQECIAVAITVPSQAAP